MKFLILLILATASITEPRKEIAKPAPRVMRYRCVVHETQPKTGAQIVCFEPDDGRMFRPERRFNEFVLEVPAL